MCLFGRDFRCLTKCAHIGLSLFAVCSEWSLRNTGLYVFGTQVILSSCMVVMICTYIIMGFVKFSPEGDGHAQFGIFPYPKTAFLPFGSTVRCPARVSLTLRLRCALLFLLVCAKFSPRCRYGPYPYCCFSQLSTYGLLLRPSLRRWRQPKAVSSAMSACLSMLEPCGDI